MDDVPPPVFVGRAKVTKLQVSETGSTNRVEVQVARMIVVMVLAFLVTWLPYAAMALAVITDSTLHIDPVIATIPVYLAKSSTVYNPIIYIFMNRQVFLRQRTAALDAPPSPRLTVCRVCVCVCFQFRGYAVPSILCGWNPWAEEQTSEEETVGSVMKSQRVSPKGSLQE